MQLNKWLSSFFAFLLVILSFPVGVSYADEGVPESPQTASVTWRLPSEEPVTWADGTTDDILAEIAIGEKLGESVPAEPVSANGELAFSGWKVEGDQETELAYTEPYTQDQLKELPVYEDAVFMAVFDSIEVPEPSAEAPEPEPQPAEGAPASAPEESGEAGSETAAESAASLASEPEPQPAEGDSLAPAPVEGEGAPASETEESSMPASETAAESAASLVSESELETAPAAVSFSARLMGARALNSSSATPPTLAEWTTWYKGSTAKSAFTTVEIVNSYSPGSSVTVTESWDASAAQDGSITAYVVGTKLIIAGNGSGSIVANECSMGFFQSFSSVTSFKGLELLDMSKVKTIQSYFSSCSSVKSLDLSSWNTASLGVYDGTEAYPRNEMGFVFSGCSALESIDVSGWDVDNVSSMTFLFSNCSALKSIDLSTWKPDNLVYADNIFLANSSLETVTGITGWGANGKIDRTNHLFNHCNSLKTVDISNWNVSNCTNMDRMFYWCNELTSVNMTGWDTSSCESFHMMFYECPVLNNLDLSGFDTSAASTLYMFSQNCYGLTNIILGPNFGQASNTTSGSVFYVNTNDADRFPTGKLATRVTGANSVMAFGAYDWDDDNREKMPDPILAAGSTWYKGATAKSSITAINIVDSYVPDGTEKESWDASAAGDYSVRAFVSSDGKTLTIAGNAYGKVFANADSAGAFKDFSGAVSVNGLSILDTSNTTTFEAFFKGCSSLTSLPNLGSLETGKSTKFKNFFEDCSSLQSLDISSWDWSSAKDMDFMFDSCKNLKTLKLPTAVAPNIFSVTQMFHQCYALESLDVSCLANGKLKYADSLFQRCTNLTSLKGYETLVTSETERMSAFFNSCNKLTTLDLSRWDTRNAESFYALFSNCHSLTTLKGLGNWNTSNVTDMMVAFNDVAKLKTIDGITNWNVAKVKSFDQTFANCTALASLNLSGWNTASGTDFESMFYLCENLKVLDISGFNTKSATDMENMFYGNYRLQQVTLGSNFTFSGSGSTRLTNLPTPNDYYISGANGRWQAVGAGTVQAPMGTVYLPADVPSNVAETYVMPLVSLSVDVPVKVVLAADATGAWCTPTAEGNQLVNHSLLPVQVTSAKTAAVNGFTMMASDAVKSSDVSNVFGGTIAAGTGAAQDLASIDTSGSAWTMAAETAADDSDLISLQLAGSVANVEGKYFTAPAQMFTITYTFDLVL